MDSGVLPIDAHTGTLGVPVARMGTFAGSPSPAAAPPRPRLGALTPGLRRVATLPALLPEWELVTQARRDAPLDAVLAWGRKPSAAVAEARAARDGLPLIRVEDGFLRSVGLGHREPPLSLVVDDLGIYYDAGAPSRLERLIATTPLDAARLDRARALREMWVQGRVSKYNHSRADVFDGARRDGGNVLVVDQTAGDASIAGAGAAAVSFHAMLEAALDEHPRARVLLKVHPDVLAGRKRGHFERLSAAAAASVDVVATDVHAPALLEACDAVYVVSSQMGFEALLWQRPVRCFGMPFYAGWGLTHDALAAPARRGSVGIEALVHSALVQYPRYLDPETGALTTPERLLAHLALQREQRARFAPALQVLACSRWKQPIARAFFAGSELQFLRRPAQVRAHEAVVVWGRRAAPAANEDGGRTIRVEDGFLRSVGLGADLTRPLSWVQDELGIYFDATRPSRLEHLLAGHDFSDALRERARALRRAIVASGITKYNVGAQPWQAPANERLRVLVPGQVESDASLQWGHAGIRTNLALLQAARRARPDAWLVYKPHPDVLAGLRDRGARGARELEALRACCDEVVSRASMGALLTQVDEVHTMTSLAGFEALMRGTAVVTWGLPFYAGWGLTEDRAPADSPALLRRAQRGRRLTLDELVAATLILYPTYVSRTSGTFTTPERALAELCAWQRDGGHDAAPGAAWRAFKRRVLGLAARWRGV